jgi:hypothetical protein
MTDKHAIEAAAEAYKAFSPLPTDTDERNAMKSAILAWLKAIAQDEASDLQIYRMALAGNFCGSGGPGSELTQIMRAVYREALRTLLERAKEQKP